MTTREAISIVNSTPLDGKALYQKYTLEEETKRISSHYDANNEFFATITGGKWNTYSSNIFEDDDTISQAQERNLDEFARLMNLKPGMRILDIGCGWGGHLVYLCNTYGCTGVGITVSAAQVSHAENRSKSENSTAKFVLSHWETFNDNFGFDAIFTDEVVVHINDFDGFFRKCHSLLKKGGMLVNKELHLTSDKFKDWSGPVGVHVNKIFGYTGNYRLLEEEIHFGLTNGFHLASLKSIAISNYQKTVANHWIINLVRNRKKLVAITSDSYVREYYKYLRCTLVSFRSNVFKLHMLAFQKVDK